MQFGIIHSWITKIWRKAKISKEHGFQTFIGLFQTTTFAGEISSALDRPKEMMENLNIIQISHLAFDFNWLMVPYDISIKWASLMGPHFCTTAVLKITMSHSDILFFTFFRHISLPKRPLCSPTFANLHNKRFASPIFDKSGGPISFLALSQSIWNLIFQRHTVTNGRALSKSPPGMNISPRDGKTAKRFIIQRERRGILRTYNLEVHDKIWWAARGQTGQTGQFIKAALNSKKENIGHILLSIFGKM